MIIRVYIPAHYDRMDMVKALTSSGYHTWIEDNGFVGTEKKYFVCFECDDNEVERFDHEGNEIKPRFSTIKISCSNCKHLDKWTPTDKNCPCQYCNRSLLNMWEAKDQVIEKSCKNCVYKGTDVCIEHCDDHWMTCFKPKAESEEVEE